MSILYDIELILWHVLGVNQIIRLTYCMYIKEINRIRDKYFRQSILTNAQPLLIKSDYIWHEIKNTFLNFDIPYYICSLCQS